MVVAISGDYIKYHPPEQLFCFRIWKAKHSHSLKQLLVTVRSYISKIIVLHCAKTLHMNFPFPGFPVKSSRHKMSSSVFFKQPAFGHFNFRGFSHQVVCHFNTTITVRCTELRVSNTIEFYYPCLLYTSPSPRDRTRSRMP